MSAATTADTSAPRLHVREFFLARQPILDRDQQLIAYELLFRGAAGGPANITSDLSATAAVIAHASQLGMDKVIGDSIGFVNVDDAVLMSDIFHFLPRDKVILEIVETVKATPELLARVEELTRAGYRFALDDVIVDSEDVRQLLPLVEIIKLDLRDMPLSALLTLTPRFKLQGKKLLAEKVETQEQFKICLDLGFDFFQGYYFAKPLILTGRKLSPSQIAIMQLLSLIMLDTDDTEIEKVIKQDVTLGINLLRLVNTPAVGVPRRINSLSQALMVFGRNQLQRWLQIMLYAEPCKKGHSMTPLLTLAAARGKMLELMAQKLYAGNRGMADIAFTVGIMSMLDTLFSLPMEEILKQIPVVDDVVDALLSRKGLHGDMLSLAECMENLEEAGPQLLSTLDKLGLSADDLCQIGIAAYEWSDEIARRSRQLQ
ncbi:MAG TPA: EAL domain-containing protein [Paucimonas sp.]|nr:EAL domain-containing protein [Paucimonas sp.]